jgi:hypothetical protein
MFPFNPDYGTPSGKRLNESLAQVIGTYATNAMREESVTNDSIASSILGEVYRDGIKFEHYYKGVIQTSDKLNHEEELEEKEACDSNENYLEVYAIPRLGVAEALASNPEMSLPKFIKEAFTNPDSFRIGIPDYVLDQNRKIITALKSSYFFDSTLKSKAEVMVKYSKEIGLEANYLNNRLEANQKPHQDTKPDAISNP